MATSLVKMYPRLRVHVQVDDQTEQTSAAPMSQPKAASAATGVPGPVVEGQQQANTQDGTCRNGSSSIPIQRRTLGSPQTIRNAAVYVVPMVLKASVRFRICLRHN